MTFLRSVASGSDNPTTAIMKASAVPIGIPLETKTSMTNILARKRKSMSIVE